MSWVYTQVICWVVIAKGRQTPLWRLIELKVSGSYAYLKLVSQWIPRKDMTQMICWVVIEKGGSLGVTVYVLLVDLTSEFMNNVNIVMKQNWIHSVGCHFIVHCFYVKSGSNIKKYNVSLSLLVCTFL